MISLLPFGVPRIDLPVEASLGACRMHRHRIVPLISPSRNLSNAARNRWWGTRPTGVASAKWNEALRMTLTL
jgi:hypothetical protein